MNTPSLQPNNNKIHVVVAMPFQPGLPFDPHWYTPEYVTYIRDLLPQELYEVSGFFVSLQNIPEFISRMENLHAHKENIVIFNACDGGEWDGYPGISLLTAWEEHPVRKKIAMTGSDSSFILHSDDKAKMNLYMRKAKLRSLPQALVVADEIETTNLTMLIEENNLGSNWPLFCKLNIGAGALGIGPGSVCYNMQELQLQVDKMHTLFPTSKILIQPYLPGPEYTVLVLQDKPYVATVRSFQNPLNIMLDDYLFGVRPVAEELTYSPVPESIQTIAVQAVQAIPGKHHYTRVDMRADESGNIFVIDINDRPGFGPNSSLQTILDHYHMSESKLLQDILGGSSFF